MAEKITFESYERRIDKIKKVLKEYGINSIEEAKEICDNLFRKCQMGLCGRCGDCD